MAGHIAAGLAQLPGYCLHVAAAAHAGLVGNRYGAAELDAAGSDGNHFVAAGFAAASDSAD